MVAGIPLLDAVAKAPFTYDGDAPADLELRIANELVAASLDDYRHIEALDVCGPTKQWRRLYVRETEAQMRQLHEGWLAPARDLLARMREMAKAGRNIDRLEELEDAVLVTRGLLIMTLDEIEQGEEEIRRGEFVTSEELRRELRAQASPSRS
jgi:hypothetical protein